MAVDISGASYFMPILSLVFVFVIVYALLLKTKLLGDSVAINLIISFIVSVIFAVFVGTREYVETVTPWFVVLIIALFFILVIVGFSGIKSGEIIKPGFVWVFIILLIGVFILAAISVFPSSVGNAWDSLSNFVIENGRISGAVILLIIAGLVAWVIVKK